MNEEKRGNSFWRHVIITEETGIHCYDVDSKGRLITKFPRQKRRKLKIPSNQDKMYSNQCTIVPAEYLYNYYIQYLQISNDTIKTGNKNNLSYEENDKNLEASDNLDLTILEQLNDLEDQSDDLILEALN